MELVNHLADPVPAPAAHCPPAAETAIPGDVWLSERRLTFRNGIAAIIIIMDGFRVKRLYRRRRQAHV